MNAERIFHVVCLIVYGLFQFYQAYSSSVTVFIEYKNHFEVKIKFLTGFHIFGLITSSILLIIGGLKLKRQLLLSALPYLIYKVGFFFWHLRKAYDLTIGCEETRESFCDPKRVFKFYIHLLMFCKKINLPQRSIFKILSFSSTFDDHNHTNYSVDYQNESKSHTKGTRKSMMKSFNKNVHKEKNNSVNNM
jgi:hypothetical protein